MDLRPRSLLQRLTTDPDTGPDSPDTADSAPDTSPDSPDTAPRQPMAGTSRLPDWWRIDKPGLDDLERGEAETPAVLTKADEDDDQELVADVDEEDVADDEDEKDEDENDEEDEPRRRWRPRGSAAYRRPTYYDRRPAPKQGLIDWWLGMPGRNRWLLYNGVAVAVGFSIGAPQFFTAETAHLVHTYGSWTDPHVLLWYGIAVGICAWDSRTRNWFPLFAIAARIPLISMVIGVLLYGSTDLPA